MASNRRWPRGVARPRRPHGGLYTAGRTFAKSSPMRPYRLVTMVPEIDLPGHALAAIAAYPELGVNGRAR